jgi:hypothetical protein
MINLYLETTGTLSQLVWQKRDKNYQCSWKLLLRNTLATKKEDLICFDYTQKEQIDLLSTDLPARSALSLPSNSWPGACCCSSCHF